MNIFDSKIRRLHRDRSIKNLGDSDFLIKKSSEQILELFEDLRGNKDFLDILILGHPLPIIGNNLTIKSDIIYRISGVDIITDEELIPFKNDSFDLVISNLNLHWINDLPGSLIQIKNILKPSGLFIASIFGGDTLLELRKSFIETEIDMEIGVSPHISPMVGIKEAGMLLQRTGFFMPVSKSEKFTILYDDTTSLMHDLRSMGETNSLYGRSKKYLGRNFFTNLDNKYRDKYSNSEEQLTATFEVITMTGWKK